MNLIPATPVQSFHKTENTEPGICCVAGFNFKKFRKIQYIVRIIFSNDEETVEIINK